MSTFATQRPPPRHQFELVVYEGQDVHAYPLALGSIVTIGRDADNDVHLEEPGVSRRHARLYIGDDVEVEDLASANGTALVRHTTQPKKDGESARPTPIEPRSRVGLQPGDVLRIGAALLVLQRSRGAHPSAPTPSSTDQAFVLVDTEMRRAYDYVTRAASSNISVLILGETGVGKEVMAEAIHRRSPRAERPFLKLNCAALPESLLEGELFGHERGAFTGAHAAKAGLIEATDTGTVFLDEIGELPLGTQVKLLRVLEERTVMRIGSSKAKTVDVRFVTATNRALAREVRAGRFRSDLYYRISGLVLQIPPLRQRKSEIEPLARYFLGMFCGRSRMSVPTLTPGAIEVLLQHDWPGNVRELRNVMERTALLTGDSVITREHILIESHTEAPEATTDDEAEEPAPITRLRTPPSKSGPAAPESERDRILRALETCGGNQTRAARVLGVSRRTLINRLDEFDLPRPKKG